MYPSRARWIWASVFVLALILVGVLAASWNVELVSQYHEMVNLGLKLRPEARPWLKVVLGSLGFLLLLVFLVSFFVKAQREMQTNTIQREFLAKLSHELKSPLSALELTSSLLRKRPESPTEETALWEAHDAELRRLKNEVNLLLESARWDSGFAKPQLIPVAMETFLKAQIESWKTSIGPHHTIERSGSPLEFTMESDPSLLALILNNFLDNARKFSPPNSCIRVITDCDSSQLSWSIQVKDEGYGFLPEEQNKIFNRFYRSQPPQTTTKFSGSGLGLYLVKRAANALKLKVKATSDGPGKGSTFVLYR